MADKEEIIFSLKVEGSDALTEMERFKKSILQTKQEQQELTKAYKAGNVTLDEFVQDSVRLEAILKKQQSSYNNVQKSVTGVKTQLDKLIDSNKKISKSFEDTAREINVAGVSVGGLTDKLASFANPATAAVGIVGALATAYVSSTIGARDLAHAQDQLSTALKLSTNEFSIFVDELGGGDGTGKDGVLSRIANYVNRAMFGVRSAVVGEIVADVKRNLQELEIAEMDSKRAAKDALKIAEDLRRTRDRQDLDIQSRLSAAYSVEQFINQREQALVQVQQDKLDNLNALLSVDKENLELKKLIKIVEFEIADIQEDSEGKRTEALNGIITLEKELAKVKDPAGGLKMKMAIPKGTNADAMQAEQDTANAILAIQVNTADKEIETHAMTEEEKTAATAMGVKNRIALAQAESDAKVLAATMVLDSVARLASEGTEIQKAASLLSIAVSTTEAVTKGIAASQSVPFPGNLVAMATTIATVLGAIANAKSSLGFAEGGWTGPGSKFQPAGIVHADEYVVPKSIVHSPSAQHHLASLEAMRLRPYADGGLVTNAMTAETNQSLVIANSMKHMPSPEVSVVEVTRVQNKVKMKEMAAKGKPFTR